VSDRRECRWQYVEPPLPTTCRLCGKTLKTYERPEGECDDCLRAYQDRPGQAER
jgi:hypothetical protein